MTRLDYFRAIFGDSPEEIDHFDSIGLCDSIAMIAPPEWWMGMYERSEKKGDKSHGKPEESF